MTEPQQGFAIGVDLGTSNTVAVIRWPDGRTRPLLVDGAPIMPSGVYVDEHGRLHVGRDAARLAGLDPSRFEPNPKRRIDEPTVLLGDREVATVDLLAAVLAAVARAAVEAVGFLPTAVLTYPAAWGTVRRDALATAARRAGWPPVMLVPEPVAAARYFADVLRRPVPVGSALAVFDFGGGTFDVAIVRNDNGRFTVLGSSGIEDLGGLDIDAALVEHLGAVIASTDPATWDALRNPATTTQRRDRRLFWDDVRGAKEMLSRTSVAPITVPGRDQAIHLTREELDRVIEPLIRRAVWETGAAIKNANLRGDQLAGLFLVGGSSRLPLAARLLHADLGIAPTVLEQPELPVAEGALAELIPAAPLPQVTNMPGAPVSGAPTSPGFGSMPAAPGSPAFNGSVSAPPSSPAYGGSIHHTPGGYPLSAAQVIPPGRGPAPQTTSFTPMAADTARRPRTSLVVAGIAAFAVLALVVGGYFVFFRNRDATVDFATLKAEKAFQMANPDDIDLTTSAVLGDRAVIGWKVKDKFYVEGLDLDGQKVAWSTVTLEHDYSRWRIYAYSAGILITGTGGSTNSIFLLDWDNGKVLREETLGTYDIFYPLNSVWVLHRSDSKTSVAFKWDGKSAWERPDNEKGSDLLGESKSADLSGPSDFTGRSTDVDLSGRTQLISVDGDDKIRLINGDDGKDIRSWNNAGDSSSKYLAYEGQLFVVGGSVKYTVNVYDLSKGGEPAQIFSAPNDTVRVGEISPCGKGLLCLIDAASSGKDDTVRAISVADKKAAWTASTPGGTTLVPTGAELLVTDPDTPASVLLSGDGKQILKDDDKKSAGVRVTSGSLLFFTGNRTSSPTNLTLVGVTASSGERIALGPAASVIGASCAWSSTRIMCAQDGKYQVWRFAG